MEMWTVFRNWWNFIKKQKWEEKNNRKKGNQKRKGEKIRKVKNQEKLLELIRNKEKKKKQPGSSEIQEGIFLSLPSNHEHTEWLMGRPTLKRCALKTHKLATVCAE